MTKFQRVADLHVNCSLQVRNFGVFNLTASDTCGASARFAVKMENGSLMWRCAQHKNIRRMETGEFLTYIEVP